MEIIHVSAECYPYAKAGGLADVVGPLPKYQQQSGHIAKVVVPMHRTKFLYDNEWNVEHKGGFMMDNRYLDYTIIIEKTNKLDFDLYCVDIYGLLDRENIYSYDDDAERFTAFQVAVVDWLSKWEHKPDVVHVLADGRIVETGGPELALQLEAHGYDWIKNRLTPETAA